MKNKLVTELAIAGTMLLVGWIIMYAAFATPYPFYVVASGSMIPALEVNDILLVQGHEKIEDVEVGDIIVFDRPDGASKVIVHRIVEITSEDPRTLRTRGDANQISIPGTDYPITGDDYIGKVIQVIPKVGYITQILAPPINYILIAIIIGIMIIKHKRGSSAPKQKPDLEVPDHDEIPHDTEYARTDAALDDIDKGGNNLGTEDSESKRDKPSGDSSVP